MMLFALMFTLTSGRKFYCYKAAATRKCATCTGSGNEKDFDFKMLVEVPNNTTNITNKTWDHKTTEEAPDRISCDEGKVCTHYAYEIDTPCELDSGPARYYWGKLTVIHSFELQLFGFMSVRRQ